MMTMNSTDESVAHVASSDAGSGLGTGLAAIGVLASLAACGGGEDSAPTVAGGERLSAMAVGTTTQKANWRFMTQASFGAAPSDLVDGAGQPKALMVRRDWINVQLLKQPKKTTVQWAVDLMNKDQTWISEPRTDSDQPVVRHHVTSAVWEQFLTGGDQLRQRVAYALSQILVVSFTSDLNQQCLALASYHDMLLRNAFGDFKTLIKEVCKHPAMGVYLSHLRNIRPQGVNTVPDQNFARELMQLFTIGQYELNMDGSLKLKNGSPVKTYTQFDIEMLSYVFTGWGWAKTKLPEIGVVPWNYTPRNRRKSDPRFVEDRRIMESPMEVYASYHAVTTDYTKVHTDWVARDAAQLTAWGISLTSPSLLKTPVSFTGDADADLNKALGIILAHPNVAPFIAKQMIQRLVTSNPTAGYVSRVANAFKLSGLSLASLVSAILTDAEAADDKFTASPTFGKLKEPVLRMTAALRAFNAKPGYRWKKNAAGVAEKVQNVFYVKDTIAVTGSGYASSDFGQGPYQSPSVFNFYRPGYIPPTGLLKNDKQERLYAPEFQICAEAELAAYTKAVSSLVIQGFGGEMIRFDGFNEYSMPCLVMDFSEEIAALDQGKGVDDLVNRLSMKLLGGTMSDECSRQLKAAFGKIKVWSDAEATAAQLGWITQSGYLNLHRVAMCAALVLMSPEFVVQK
jgi:uncharacterized protein (DUF1800 family)